MEWPPLLGDHSSANTPGFRPTGMKKVDPTISVSSKSCDGMISWEKGSGCIPLPWQQQAQPKLSGARLSETTRKRDAAKEIKVAGTVQMGGSQDKLLVFRLKLKVVREKLILSRLSDSRFQDSGLSK